MNIGKSETDKKAESLLKCRKIVAEIVNFGVSQDDIMQVIYLLALELENREALDAFVSVVKEFKNDPFEDQKTSRILEV